MLAPVWNILGIFLSTLVGINMFIAILTQSYIHITTRSRNMANSEKSYELPSWGLWVYSKFVKYCKRRSARDRNPKSKSYHKVEKVRLMNIQAKKLRESIGSVDRKALWRLVLINIADGSFDIEDSDLAPHMPGDTRAERTEAARQWMEKFAHASGIPLQRTVRELTTIEEIRTLTLHITNLEAELAQLAQQLSDIPQVGCRVPSPA